MTLAYPLALLGLLLLPYLLWLGRPRGAWERRRVWAALILRAVIVTLLVLALAGLQVVRGGDRLAVVFLIDASDSMPEAAVQAARQAAADAMRRMGPDDEAAVIVFGADALVERPMSPVRELGPLESRPLPLNTDLAEAIRLGMALFPPGAARRMVILSDGLANVGDAEGAARLAGAAGVQIVGLPMALPAGPEVLVTGLDVPTRLNEGQSFDLVVTLESSVEAAALLRVIGAGRVLVEQTVSLVEGPNRFSFTLTAGEAGLTSFRVQIIPAGDDVFYQNNELSAFSQIVGPPRVLIVSGDEREPVNLAQALLAQDFSVDQVAAGSLPLDLATLSAYQSVVLVNVPASDLGPRGMLTLQTYVRDLGGGLVVVGGPNAYGVGGYFQTPLEETLPVDMQLKDQERLPQLTVVYVIDKSGSMSDTSVGGFPKIELAKEAILRSINLLGPLDRVGVVAFDENASWVVPLGSADDRQQIGRLVGGLRASGGTDIYAGVLAVSRVLPDDPGQLRHVVLLTDGGADETGVPDLVRDMYDQEGITFSVIAIGQGYAPWIETLPDLADGRFHYAYNVDTIPEIFTEETLIATRAYIIEGEFFPALASSSPILQGISGTPPLLGYVGTSIKPTAQQILVTAQDDPLLAAWQYGLGRAVAWTSDATGRWAAAWVAWPDFARFWSQAVRWTITEGARQNVEVRVTREGEEARITVDAVDDAGDYLNGLALDASIVAPDLAATPLVLRQVAPGRYEGVFTPTQEGAYFVRVAGSMEQGGGVAQTAGWVLAYSPEYRSLEGDPDYLARLAGLTGGSLLASTEGVFAHNLPVDRVAQPVWPWLLLAAVLLLPVDIAVRRLALSRADFDKLAARLRPRRPERAPASGLSRVGALLEVKERARPADAPQRPSPGATVARLRQSRGGEPPPAPPLAPAPPPASAPPSPAPLPASRPRPEGGSTASTLLQRKRQRRGQDDEAGR